MADETIKSFLVSFGYEVDSSSMAKTESATKAAENRIVAANAAALKQRLANDRKAQNERIAAAIAAGKELSTADQQFIREQEKARADAADKERKRQDESFKQHRQQFDVIAKKTREFALGVTAVVTGVAAAVASASGGILYVVDQAAKRMEALHYMAMRTGGSAGGISAFSYAVAQSGGSADDANASLEKFGDNLRRFGPAYEQALKKMGIATRDANGNLRETSELAAEAMEKLKAMPLAQRSAQGGFFGFTEGTMQAGVRPGFQGAYADRKAINARLGYDPDKAANSGTIFEQSMRRLETVLSVVKDKTTSALFDTIKPQLDQVTQWVLDHGKAISDVVSSISKGIIDLATALVKSDVIQSAITGLGAGLETFASYINSDDFRKDIKNFIADVTSLAKAVRHGLELLGILPSSNADRATAAGADEIQANNWGALGGAITRGHKNWYGGRADTADAGKSQERLEGFRHGRGVGNFGEKDWWTPERQSHAVDRLMKEAGLTEDGAKALVARWKYVESPGGPTAVNPNGGAAGILQGLGPRRKDGLGSFDDQLGNVARSLNDGTDGSQGAAKRLLNTPGREAEGASAFERAEGYAKGPNAGTHRDNFTDRTAEGMKHIVHGVQAASNLTSAPAAPTTAPSGDHVIGDSEYLAALQRHQDMLGRRSRLTDAEKAQRTADDALMDRYHQQQAQPVAKPAQEVSAAARVARRVLRWIKKGSNVADPDDAADAPIVTVDRRDPKFAPGFADVDRRARETKAQAEEMARHTANMRTVLAAHRGQPIPYFHSRPLGDTSALRTSINNSRTRGDTSITHNPTYNINGGDQRSNLEDAHRLTRVQQADLIRNVQPSEG